MSWSHQNSGFPAVQDGPHFPHVTRHDRAAREHGLEQGEWQTFRERREYKDVSRCEHVRYIRPQTEKVDTVAEAQLVSAAEQRICQVAASRYRDVGARIAVA